MRAQWGNGKCLSAMVIPEFWKLWWLQCDVLVSHTNPVFFFGYFINNSSFKHNCSLNLAFFSYEENYSPMALLHSWNSSLEFFTNLNLESCRNTFACFLQFQILWCGPCNWFDSTFSSLLNSILWQFLEAKIS